MKDALYNELNAEMFIHELKERKTRAYKNAQRIKALKVAVVVTIIIAVTIIL